MKKIKLLFAIIMVLALGSSCKKEPLISTEPLKTDLSETQTLLAVDEPEDDSDEPLAISGQSVTRFPSMATSINSPQPNGYLWDGPTGCLQVGGGAATAALSANGVCNTSTQCFRSAKLQVTGFGFNIPANATIDNVKVKINCKASVSNSIKDLSVQLANWDNAGVTTLNKAKNTFWGTTYSLRTYGGPINSWCDICWDILRPAEPDFGVRISCKNLNTSSSAIASIDYVKITIHYTLGGNLQSQSSTVSVSQ